MTKFTDIGVEKHGHVGLIEIQRPPLNFFDISLINQIADALEGFDKDIEIRASVLAAQGKAFCAGANFGDPARQAQEAREAEKKGDPADNLGPINHLYILALLEKAGLKPDDVTLVNTPPPDMTVALLAKGIDAFAGSSERPSGGRATSIR